MRSITILSLIGFVVWLGACAPAVEEPLEEATSTEADVEAVNSLHDEYVTVHNDNDAERLAALYTQDAVLMPPNEPARAGNQAVQSWFQDAFDQSTAELSLASDEVQVTADSAFDRGTYTIKLTPKSGGEAIEDNGKWILILRKQPDGSWKIARAIWNSDKPPS
ncbi:SgcJ/EcaC family oxidoreductase, partial [Acidobacteria bacterium AH-259-O06]|nr:SgcJ/EcaC family oxidoreductase [Acidobacteria bacterium AH-259-O06]